jgi:AcrR family transcriptional regulator
MGAEHPHENLSGQEAEATSKPPEGCFSDCLICRRLRTAAVELAVGDGIDRITDRAVAELAGVPLEQAVQHYPSVEACLAAAYDEGALILRRVCARALRGEGSWQERLHSAVDMAVDAFSERPQLARYCFVDAWRSDLPMVSASRVADRERFVRILAEQHGQERDDVPELRFEVLLGAAHHAVAEQLDGQGGEESVRERLGQLIDVFEQPTALRS